MTRFADRRVSTSDYEAARRALEPMSWRGQPCCGQETERDDESERESDAPDTETETNRDDVGVRERALRRPWDVGPR